MRRHKYELGLWEMLAHAWHEHYRQSQGLLPKRFEMPLANWCELRMDERMKYMMFAPEKPEFMGVPIVVDAQADQLKMVTSDNTVEFL